MSNRLAEAWDVPTIVLAALLLALAGFTHLLLWSRSFNVTSPGVCRASGQRSLRIRRIASRRQCCRPPAGSRDMETILTRADAAGLHHPGWQPGRAVLRMPKWLRRRYTATAVIGLWIALVGAADRWLRTTTIESLPATVEPAAHLFDDPVAISITVSTAGQTAPWVTTDHELRESVEMWKRMHLADWNGVPGPLRSQALDNMMRRYRQILNNPKAWDRMAALDWDAVPQPIRTIAYRRMTGYWSGFYGVGSKFGLASATVSETLAAIVMSESWFDHRARSMNRDGTWDVGLGQASPFARQRLRELLASGHVDAALSEEEYFDPWMATRFVALWMKLMIEESHGDLDLAVRAYNRGSADAMDGRGADYLAAVQQRLARFIRNRDAPPSWDYLWRRS
jgi:hypothetical protein